MKAKYIIGGIIIVVFMIWGASAFFKTTIQYVTIEQARNSDKTVQVMGKIDFDDVNYNTEDSRLEFAIYDAESESKTNAETISVVYYGVVPGNFDQATSVVLKGKSENEVFVADQMLVKCPSKYQGEGEEGYQDITKHNKATNKDGA
ncbi:MAG: cytochrome c maturation protein CcmE [Candidatus Zixiibacteriota bacterium]|nr:MAG: cytochrome c maturation protein CcmE [candidate division Zixibacteria bacterium]